MKGLPPPPQPRIPAPVHKHSTSWAVSTHSPEESVEHKDHLLGMKYPNRSALLHSQTVTHTHY